MWIVVWVAVFAGMRLVGEEGSSETSEVKPFYMTIAVIKTKAEQQLAAEFERVAGTLPGGGWVPAMRQAAMGAFAGTGLPHRKIEAWKYTDLRALVKEVPPPVTAKAVSIDETALAAALGFELAKLPCNRLVFVDGAFVADASGPTPDLGTDFHFRTLADSLGKPDFDWMKGAFETTGEAKCDPLLALNAAFVTDGVTIRVVEGAELAHPIHLIFLSTSATPAASSTRNLIRIEKGAHATILESHIAAPGAARQSNSVTGLHICAGADVQHLKLIAEGAPATHFGTWSIELDANATYDAFQMTESVALARHQLFVTFKGDGAAFNFNAAVLGRGKSHIDTTMVIDHAVPRCTSRELLKCVLDGESRGVFQGKVIVRPDAQKSDGKQMAKALLLSPNAEFDSKPELEIYADDVVCGHGSTVAEIDEDQVFYLSARGIPARDARALLIEAFAAEAIDAIAHVGIRKALRARLNAWLAAGA